MTVSLPCWWHADDPNFPSKLLRRRGEVWTERHSVERCWDGIIMTLTFADHLNDKYEWCIEHSVVWLFCTVLTKLQDVFFFCLCSVCLRHAEKYHWCLYVNIYIVLALDVGLLELKMCMIVLFLCFIFHKTFELIDRVPPWLPSCSKVASLNL